MNTSSSQDQDPLTAASNAVAIVIALNKPIYPLYVWWLTDSAFHASLLTVAAFPFYAALPWLAKHSAVAARAGLAIVGTADTILITRYMGESTGGWLFLSACLMLAAVSFYRHEIWLSRGLIAAIFCLGVGFAGHYGEPLATISAGDAATLFTLNTAGALALIAFIGLRYPRPER